MSQKIIDYALALSKLSVERDVLQLSQEILGLVPELQGNLMNPLVDAERKYAIVDKIFPREIREFLKSLCDNQDIEAFDDICSAYGELANSRHKAVEAVILYVTPPEDEQMVKIMQFLKKKFGEDVAVRLVEDKSIIGGFILRADNQEYDWSMRGRLQDMERKLADSDKSCLGSSDEIIAILRTEIDETEFDGSKREIGVVTWIGDGIANIDGIDHAMYGEIVIFDTGVKGMVQDVRYDEIGCILFGRETGVREGTRVIRTGKKAGMPVGEAFIGRVVDAQGAPIDGRGQIAASEYRPIENEAPGIVDRQSVSVPMETGILAIDSMFPIGRGQRELIIGDRQTGKTSIAMDAILNQKGKDVICIYVAIGQKASTISKLVSTLNQYGAMEYTIILSATASEPAPMQYIAPYSGTALAEYFMHKGKDVLIVYDDLSKHAVAYRALSLLLERSPGREAYPGDVFYLHSRLLERSSRLSKEKGGGSITALPIIETLAGDVSAYIPTNVISITDGQIFLESNLFFSGMRPAVNVGLSVSRVGGAAQSKAMKKASGSVRIDLAQFREMEVFTQFSSDLDDMTKAQLTYGSGLMELLKQPLCHPLSMEEQVITLCAATHKIFMDVDKKEVKQVQMGMLSYFSQFHPEVSLELEEKRTLSEELSERILEVAREYKDRRQQLLQVGSE